MQCIVDTSTLSAFCESNKTIEKRLPDELAGAAKPTPQTSDLSGRFTTKKRENQPISARNKRAKSTSTKKYPVHQQQTQRKITVDPAMAKTGSEAQKQIGLQVITQIAVKISLTDDLDAYAQEIIRYFIKSKIFKDLEFKNFRLRLN